MPFACDFGLQILKCAIKCDPYDKINFIPKIPGRHSKRDPQVDESQAGPATAIDGSEREN